MHERDTVELAADAVRDAEAMVILTGAGMGVDAGLPDYRGSGGMYAYDPKLDEMGLNAMQIATPIQMMQTPRLCWGYFAAWRHKMKTTAPHVGFEVLMRWAKEREAFAFTSNVDTMLQRAGLDEERVVECHGTLEYLQAMLPDTYEDPIWPTGDLDLSWDPETMEAIGELPRATYTDQLARPNALLFMDASWLPARSWAQEERFEQWLETISGSRVVLIECGAGASIPTVRMRSQKLLGELPNATLIRINPQKLGSPEGTLYLQRGAAEALSMLAEHV